MPNPMGFALRVAVYRLRGYREWTETLGEDREWVIQARQGEVYSLLSVAAAEAGGLALPFRHDIHLVLASGVPHERLEYIRLRLAEVAPTPVELRVGCGSSPREAVEGSPCSGSREAVLLAHVDVNDITGFEAERGLYEAYLHVTRLYYGLAEMLSDYGGLVSYLGGDNLLAVLPFAEDALHALEEVLEEYDAKAGVGFAHSARAAARQATACLDEARRRGERLLVCASGEAPTWLTRYSGGLL